MTKENSNPRANAREGFRLITPLRVRYNEADMQGIVFNAHYLSFADIGITEYFRDIAGQGEDDSAGGGSLSLFGGDCWVRHAEVDFRSPARADELLDICVRVTRFGRTSFSSLIRIVRGDTLLNEIKMTQVWFDPETEKTAPVAQKFIDAVEAYEIIKPERAVVTG